MLETLVPQVKARAFSDLNLAPQIMSTITEMAITTLTPIQDKSFETLMAGRDLVGCSQTGSGKTVAFLLPIISRLMAEPSLNALVMTPTRELAAQVHDVAIALSRQIEGFRCALVVGGGRMQRQHQALKRTPRIVVATPGRLLDHLYNHSLKLKTSSIVVLDEADRMLDMGFAPQIEKVFATLPKERQTILFSATFSKEVARLIERITKNPHRISVETNSNTKPKIDERFINTSMVEKSRLLNEELTKNEGSVLIFGKTQIRVDKLARKLEDDGFSVERIHGGCTMGQRRGALEAFKSGEARILIATDIAARGIDVDDVSLVINYDAPQAAEDYVHRIGRTGRAGKTGIALSFVCPEDRRIWQEIQHHGSGKKTYKNEGGYSQPFKRRPHRGSKPFGKRVDQNRGEQKSDYAGKFFGKPAHTFGKPAGSSFGKSPTSFANPTGSFGAPSGGGSAQGKPFRKKFGKSHGKPNGQRFAKDRNPSA